MYGFLTFLYKSAVLGAVFFMVRFGIEAAGKSRGEGKGKGMAAWYGGEDDDLGWWFQLFLSTPWKINMEPKNEGLEDDVPFQKDDFEVPC